jgi:hypothetical protein
VNNSIILPKISHPESIIKTRCNIKTVFPLFPSQVTIFYWFFLNYFSDKNGIENDNLKIKPYKNSGEGFELFCTKKTKRLFASQRMGE